MRWTASLGTSWLMRGQTQMDEKQFWDANGNWVDHSQDGGKNMDKQLVNGTQALATEAANPGPSNANGAFSVVNGEKPHFRETEETKKLKENYEFFGPVTALYALFYAFCMYKNASGITFPFFVAGSFLYFYFSMKKLEITLKSGSAFYAVSMMLLAISTFCTDDARIIALNKTGIFLLAICFLMAQFFQVKNWGLGKYLSSILKVVLSAIELLPRPIQDMTGFAKKGKSGKTKNLLYVLLGLFITAPIFLIVAVLLSSADALFREMTDHLVYAVNFGNVFGVIFSILFWYFAIYLIMANLCRKNVREEVRDHHNGEPILAITVTSMLTLMYLVFSAIQIFGLFLGQMELPEGYTYAKYAREGFFQLLAVSILNLIIVLVCMSFFRESKVLKAILTVTSLCTFIMIASSAMRMILYVQTYNLTFLRIFVLWALAVLFFLFLGVVIQIFKSDFPLFRYCMIIVTVFYIGLAFSHPDLIIAKFNLENSDGKLDYKYLSELSADAAPALIPYLSEQGYDLSVVTALQSEKTQENQERNLERYEREASGDNYWEIVKKVCGDQSLKKNKAETFGYYYLQSIREDYQEMGFRNFNLSRFSAVRMVTK